jgi:putative ATP-dependent endonuclease of OLD family
MRLTKVIIENFRGYRERTEIAIEDLTSIIGCNDVGKSTIMEAIGIFFECDAVKIDAQDVNVSRSGEPCSVSCVFEGFPAALVIDAQAETTFAAEHLLNGDGQLEILKQWDCGGKTPKCSVFARALHPTAPKAADLLQIKNAGLKDRVKDLGIDLKALGVDARSNVALRRAIRESVGALDLAMTAVPLQAEDGKKVWDEIQKELPAFALFRADRPSKDDDPEVADPMKIAVQEAMKSVEAQLADIRETVRARTIEVATRTLEKLREMDPTLASELHPTFKAEPKFDGFKLSLTGDGDIPINKRGSGVRRMILLNFFRAEAERKRLQSGNPGIIYAIEEPEASLHPDKQTILVKALMELSQVDGTQVLLTTHAPGLASLLPQDSIRFVNRRDDNHPQVETGEGVLDRVAAALGVTPDPRPHTKVLLFVEGPHDVKFLQHMCRLLRSADPNVICIETDPRVAVVIVGGGNLKHWVERRYLERLGCAEVHIYDRDDAAAPKYKVAVDTLNQRAPKVWAALTRKREMENYLHTEAINAALNVALGFTDDCDVPTLTAQAIHVASNSPNQWIELPEKKREKKESKAKSALNERAAGQMTMAHLLQRDPHGEVKGWFDEIRLRASE